MRLMSSFMNERRRNAPARVGKLRSFEGKTAMRQAATPKAGRLREPGLLLTESRTQFLRLRKSFHNEINPSWATERLYVDWV